MEINEIRTNSGIRVASNKGMIVKGEEIYISDTLTTITNGTDDDTESLVSIYANDTDSFKVCIGDVTVVAPSLDVNKPHFAGVIIHIINDDNEVRFTTYGSIDLTGYIRSIRINTSDNQHIVMLRLRNS